MKQIYSLSSLYRTYKTDTLFTDFYNECTQKCHIHNPMMYLYIFNNDIQSVTKIISFLLQMPNLFEKMKLTNLLASYNKFINRKTTPTKFYEKWEFVSNYVFMKEIIYMVDYDEISDEKFYLKCKRITDNIKNNENDIGKKIKWESFGIDPQNFSWSEHIQIFGINIDFTIKSFLETISPFIKTECKCHRPFYNYEIMKLHSRFPKDRLDLIEKIVWETEINDYFYFVKIYDKIRLITSGDIGRRNKSSKNKIDINSLNEPQKCKIFDYYQLYKKCGSIIYELAIYNNYFISSNKLSYLTENEINYKYVSLPTYCFVCEKHDIKLNFNLSVNEFICYEKKKEVRGFACKNCKKDISKILNINCTKKVIINHSLDEDDEEDASGVLSSEEEECVSLPKNISYFQKRRLKPLMLIMARLFDSESLFEMLPMDILYSIIFSIYWEPVNALVDNSDEFYDRKDVILYSEYRKKIEK